MKNSTLILLMAANLSNGNTSHDSKSNSDICSYKRASNVVSKVKIKKTTLLFCLACEL